MSAGQSYHDVHVTTATIPRTALSALPYGYELTCNRVGGWCLWGPPDRPVPYGTRPKLVGGEYDRGLRVDVAGHVICDSLTRAGSTPRSGVAE